MSEILSMVETGAEFSECGKYRYALWRIWDTRKPLLMMLMLNPSIAGAEKNDPTVARQSKRAEMLGFGGLLVGNIFAFVATDPRHMKRAADPVGPENDAKILELAKAAGMIICAWGVNGAYLYRSGKVINLLRKEFDLYALRVTKAGHPEHPLYLRYNLQPKLYVAKSHQESKPA